MRLNRVYGGDDNLTTTSGGAVAHADDARKAIVFIHNIINDPLPVF
jgi:hypothetical protein